MLDKTPILFEAVPPPRRAGTAHVNQLLDRLEESLKGIPRLSAVNIPEVLDENHMGRPYYRSQDARAFGQKVRDRLGCDVAVNKVVVHLPSRGAFVTWARETVKEHGIRNLILVGGSSSLRKYPGPGVTEAAGMVSHLFRSLDVQDGLVGSIAIPSRANEAEKLFAKTLSGCRFATTQILFGAENLLDFLREYDRLCKEHSITPSTVIVSIAPVSDIHDLEFVRWLGAEVPEVVEDRLFRGAPEAAKAQSIRLAEKLWVSILDYRRKAKLNVPLGLNIEQVSHHNLDAAIEMTRRLSGRLAE